MLTKTRPKTRNGAAGRMANVAPARRKVATSSSRVCLGVLVAWDEKGPLVDFEGNLRAPVRARVARGTTRVQPPPGTTQEVVLLVEARPNRPPVLLGLLQPLGSEAEASAIEARVDGRRVELEGRDEVVLRCGEATITLRRNGRILIRGVQVETRASGVNRIRGGSVAIN